MPDKFNEMNMYLLGDTFIRHFYSIFNYTLTATEPNTRMIGLAQNAQYVKDGYIDSPVKIINVGDIHRHTK